MSSNQITENIHQDAEYIIKDGQQCHLCDSKLVVGYFDRFRSHNTAKAGCMSCGTCYRLDFDEEDNIKEIDFYDIDEIDRIAIKKYYEKTGNPAAIWIYVPVKKSLEKQFREWWNNEFSDWWEENKDTQLPEMLNLND